MPREPTPPVYAVCSSCKTHLFSRYAAKIHQCREIERMAREIATARSDP